MDEQRYADILATLVRYRDHYGWSFNMARRLINRTFSTDYTDRQLAKLYRQFKADADRLP